MQPQKTTHPAQKGVLSKMEMEDDADESGGEMSIEN